MSPLTAVKKPTVEIAHILQKHLEDYKRQYRLGSEHRKILSDLLNCRTAKMGGRVDRCDTCGSLRIAYHSCRNRHCPKCQHMPRERWLAKRKEEILPVNYFHVVFTLPHELNAVILNHKKLMLNCLFAAVSQTILRFGKNEMSGTPGFWPSCTPGTKNLRPTFTCTAWWQAALWPTTENAGSPSRATTSLTAIFALCDSESRLGL